MHLHSVLPVRCPAHGHTHSAQVVFYLTDLAKDGTCLWSKITMLPLSAVHQPWHRCKRACEATMVDLDMP